MIADLIEDEDDQEKEQDPSKDGQDDDPPRNSVWLVVDAGIGICPGLCLCLKAVAHKS